VVRKRIPIAYRLMDPIDFLDFLMCDFSTGTG